MAVTIYEIAKEAKVSKSAVSAVLGVSTRSGSRVGTKTRARIQAVAQGLGYRPNLLAKGLAGGRTRTVGVLWSLGGPHPSEGMARNITLGAQRHDYVTHLADHLSDPAVARRLLGDFRRRGVEAVVLEDGTGWMAPDLEAPLREFAAVVVVSSRPATGNWDWIHRDRVGTYREMADHFARTGRRTPAILAHVSSQSKIDAFLGRCRWWGMRVTEESILDVPCFEGSSLTASYRKTLDGRFPGRFPFDALMCSSDEGAAVALTWLRSRGLGVPEDVAVCGFNNTPFAELLSPPLASGDRRDAEVAACIEEMIFDRLADPESPPRRRSIPMRFIWRESAGATPAGPLLESPS
jgi:LacI family transcriptional regulator